MRKTEFTLDATRVPNNIELVMAALRLGLRSADELADHASISRGQTDWALSQLRAEGHAEFRRDGRNTGWYATDDAPLNTIIVTGAADSPWTVLGYPAGVIAPLVGRVHRLPG